MNCKDVARLGERIYEAELPNGLSIRVVPKPGFSRKYALIAADYGSADTKFTLNGKTVTTPDGVAHYLEHKMFDTPKGDAMEQFAAMGASPNAFTSYDMTAYYFSCTEHFESPYAAGDGGSALLHGRKRGKGAGYHRAGDPHV